VVAKKTKNRFDNLLLILGKIGNGTRQSLSKSTYET
jgi:hypothetical protein